MKRNKHIDRKLSILLIFGLLLTTFSILYLAILLLSGIIEGEIFTYLKIGCSILSVLVLLKLISTQIEKRLLEKFQDSIEYKLMLKQYNFHRIREGHFEGKRNIYDAVMYYSGDSLINPFEMKQELWVDL
ncbi:MAG: hypothetical protein AAF696_32320, partial [Bacteroidota bacterium]